jgi:hypothetical protein
MKYHHPLKKISYQAQSYWDRDDMRAAVRQALRKALQCRTAELGAEVYSSENQELILYHTCKSRACPSCGYRATVQWLRERWAALPDALYKGITFTMPDLLWPFFRDNPPLAKALSALAAELIQARVSAQYGSRVGVIAILHTFNGKLEFNSHVHTMVTGGGLHGSSNIWVDRVYYVLRQLRQRNPPDRAPETDRSLARRNAIDQPRDPILQVAAGRATGAGHPPQRGTRNEQSDPSVYRSAQRGKDHARRCHCTRRLTAPGGATAWIGCDTGRSA